MKNIHAGELHFVFPAKSKNHGFRLGNVEILSRSFGMIDVNERDYLRVLRIGNLTLRGIVRHTRGRQGETARRHRSVTRRQAPLPQRSTYFDCTDYIDRDDPAKPDTRNNWLALLTFALRNGASGTTPRPGCHGGLHLHLLFAYVVHHQKPNVHGGLFRRHAVARC